MNTKLIAVLLIGATISTRAAVVVTPNQNGQFDLSTSNGSFTTWATENGATMTGSFGTYGTGFGTQSGATASSSTATLNILFSAGTGYAFDTAVLNLSAAIWSIGDSSFQNMPAGWVYATVGDTQTKVFEWVSSEQLPEGSAAQYNYSGAAPDASFYGRFSTTVDLSSLVSGTTQFQLSFVAQQAWPSELGYGGSFYQDNSTPFSLSGQVAAVPEPHTVVLAAAGFVCLMGWRRKLR